MNIKTEEEEEGGRKEMNSLSCILFNKLNIYERDISRFLSL